VLLATGFLAGSARVHGTDEEAVVAVTERVEMRGHVLDAGDLPRVLNAVLEAGSDYVIERFDVGREAADESYVRIAVTCPDAAELDLLLNRLMSFGANRSHPGELLLREVDVAGSFPLDFYSTTNYETEVLLQGAWTRVENPEMDCAIVVDADGPRTVPMSDVTLGDRIVCGTAGVRVVLPPTPPKEASTFEFMNSVVSSEKPQALQVRRVAAEIREVKQAGKRVLLVGGPAIVHTGAAPALAALIKSGWIDVLFAGNALAAHDIEANLYGTSLGVDLSTASGVDHGHEHHIRAINRVRRAGSIAAAVEEGIISGGVMHAMVTEGKRFVLVGSVRDDGPLPDTIADVIEGQRQMRAALTDVGYALMVATMLHAIATGNILPASIPLVCVDINPATVTKLADRGSAQAEGLVTDIGLFLETLASELVPGWRQEGAAPGR
jgi:lysine-ketoglutarate reductase/saccharopine dehydrogenase-like protein (TIGR00300 family)